MIVEVLSESNSWPIIEKGQTQERNSGVWINDKVE